MPTYVYECKKNGHQFEVDQKMTDEPVKKCAVCGSKVERLLFAPAIHFKGSGFHNTDYGTKKRPKEAAAADGTATTKTDATPASNGTAPASSSDSAPAAKPATVADRVKRGVGP